MKRTFLYSKIHRATVTDANLDYEGSVSIDSALMKLADIHEFESVEIYNITNGSRLRTYAIAARAGSGEICINGAAARLVSRGDLVLIACYVELEENEIARHRPRIIHLDKNNAPRAKK